MRTITCVEKPIKGEFTVAPDKSISHRAVIFSALGNGEGVVHNFLQSADTLSSCQCIRELGIEALFEGESLTVKGKGLHGLKEASGILDCGNSGTTMRLLSGLLSGQPMLSVLSGDKSLNGRPMRRVIEPLRSMGADIAARAGGNYPPLAIKGRENLEGIEYKMPVASAQVKSSLLLAGLNARSEIRIIEPEKSRDHSERMLKAMGADLEVDGLSITLKPGRELQAQEFYVPGDISSAAFFLVAALIVPGSELIIQGVGINPTRAGMIDVLLAMGANLKIENQRLVGGEPIADLVAGYSSLKSVQIDKELIPRLIDELPVLAVAMAMAEGQSVVKDAGELRVKETDRIKAICSELTKMGADIEETGDGFVIQGRPEGLMGAVVESKGDHRIAMSLAVAGLAARGATAVLDPGVVNISFPEFWNLLSMITRPD